MEEPKEDRAFAMVCSIITILSIYLLASKIILGGIYGIAEWVGLIKAVLGN